jgi:hypothetical protein
MSPVKGIQSLPYFKLGKAAARRDPRNLRFSTILRATKAPPAEYDFDSSHPGIPLPMFGNDTLGDCVIAGRAHQTLRFEDVDQHRIISIPDKAVTTEYFKTGGADSGLVVLDSLKLWRSAGWKVGRRRYRIAAFSEIAPRAAEAVRQAVYLDIGLGLGVLLPLSAQDQITAGKPWDAVAGARGKPGSWGGHYVYVPGYTALGPVCVTWGRKQQMTWAFFAKYCDEAYAIIDKLDAPKTRRGIDAPKVAAFLDKLDAR